MRALTHTSNIGCRLLAALIHHSNISLPVIWTLTHSGSYGGTHMHINISQSIMDALPLTHTLNIWHYKIHFYRKSDVMVELGKQLLFFCVIDIEKPQRGFVRWAPKPRPGRFLIFLFNQLVFNLIFSKNWLINYLFGLIFKKKLFIIFLVQFFLKID